MTFDEGGMWNWSSKSQKETIVTSNDYKEEVDHVDTTPYKPNTSNREQLHQRLPVQLQDCVLGTMTHLMKRLSTLLYLQIVSQLLLKKPLVIKIG